MGAQEIEFVWLLCKFGLERRRMQGLYASSDVARGKAVMLALNWRGRA